MRGALCVFMMVGTLLLAGCGASPLTPQQVDCRNALARNNPACAGIATSTPEATAIPTAIPPTPTPPPIQNEDYTSLMTELGGYGVTMEGFNPSTTTPFSGTLTPDVFVSADVVGLSAEFDPQPGVKPLVVILKMDDADFEQSGNYRCDKVEADKLGKVVDGKVMDLFFPGSADRYVYACAKPGDFIHGYKGWAVFVTFDPASAGPIVVRGCSSIEDCIDKPQATPTTTP